MHQSGGALSTKKGGRVALSRGLSAANAAREIFPEGTRMVSSLTRNQVPA